MKRNLGISLVLISILFTTAGSVLKIMQLMLADAFLWVGIIMFILGLALVVVKLIDKPLHIERKEK